MKHYYLEHKSRSSLFIFWLIEQLAPPSTDQKKKPISNLEFFGTMTMIIAALIALKLIFK